MYPGAGPVVPIGVTPVRVHGNVSTVQGRSLPPVEVAFPPVCLVPANSAASHDAGDSPTVNSHGLSRQVVHPTSALLALLCTIIPGLQFLISALLCSTSFLYRYLILLGLHRIRSISLPLAQLTQLVAAEAVADHDHHPEAADALKRAWGKYVRTLGRDFEMASALCAAVLALTIGLLSVTSIAEEVVTKTIAFVCMFACATGMTIALNMRRHLNNVAQTVDAATAWVCASPGNQASALFTSTPMLLAAPWAWMTWSILSFIAMLMSFVWRLSPPAMNVSTTGQTSGLPSALAYALYDAGKPKDSDTNQPTSGIVVLPWPSRIILLSLAIVAIAHFMLIAICFRKLGIPVTALDAELGHVPVRVDNIAAPVTVSIEFNCTDATPGCIQDTPAPVLSPPLVAACA